MQGVWKMRRRPENNHNHRNKHKCSFLWLEGGGGGQRAVARGLEAVEKARGLQGGGGGWGQLQSGNEHFTRVGRWWWPEGTCKGFGSSGGGWRVCDKLKN